MNKRPLISVVIPSFNAETQIAASLRSIVEQTPFDLLEILVMDGGSRDKTLEIAREWRARDPRIAVWSEPDAGVYDAMNKGIARARGRYLYFLGAGDTLRPGALEKVAALIPGDDASLLYGRIWKTRLGIEYGSRFEPIDIARRNLPHQAAFFGREIFQKMGNYNLDFPILSDYEFNIRCFGAPWIGRIYLDFVVCDYEEGGLSDTRTDERFQRQRSVLVRRELGVWPALIFWLDGHLPVGLGRALGALRQNLARLLRR